jgi:hypothetical protein
MPSPSDFSSLDGINNKKTSGCIMQSSAVPRYVLLFSPVYHSVPSVQYIAEYPQSSISLSTLSPVYRWVPSIQYIAQYPQSSISLSTLSPVYRSVPQSSISLSTLSPVYRSVPQSSISLSTSVQYIAQYPQYGFFPSERRRVYT